MGQHKIDKQIKALLYTAAGLVAATGLLLLIQM